MPETPESPRAGEEDDAWRSIVDNYGDRAEIEPEPAYAVPAPAAEEPSWSQEAERDPDDWDDDGFLPPEPPPIPRPTPDRMIAWIGVIGAPAVLLVCVLAQFRLPTILSYAFIAWFIGGFMYLVVNLPREPRDPWDDGAQI